MTLIWIFGTSAILSFFAHHFGEKFLTRNWSREVRLIFRNYHIHHSFFGILAILTAVIFMSGIYTLILLGYGIGNIWQHKYTHNQAGERGMLFISKIIKQ